MAIQDANRRRSTAWHAVPNYTHLYYKKNDSINELVYWCAPYGKLWSMETNWYLIERGGKTREIMNGNLSRQQSASYFLLVYCEFYLFYTTGTDIFLRRENTYLYLQISASFVQFLHTLFVCIERNKLRWWMWMWGSSNTETLGRTNEIGCEGNCSWNCPGCRRSR